MRFNQEIKIGYRTVAETEPALVIAEAGINHNGDLSLARELIDVAADAKADMVKFQAYDVDRLLPVGASKPGYQRRATGTEESQYDMLRRVQLTRDHHAELNEYALRQGIMLFSTPYHVEAAEYLRDIGLPAIKIASTDTTNIPLLRQVARMGMPVILSTGMCDLRETEAAVDVFAEADAADLILLHCVAEYPSPPEQSNLRAMETLRRACGTLVGYSDHSPGIGVGPYAAACGACVLEKHFTLDRTAEGPDHQASLTPGELKGFVQAVRGIESMLGDGEKRVAPCEAPNKPVLQKSLVAARDLREGQIIGYDDLKAMRPGDGISPVLTDHVVGRTLLRPLRSNERLRFAFLD
jgi:sialic acid synthase SpsE